MVASGDRQSQSSAKWVDPRLAKVTLSAYTEVWMNSSVTTSCRRGGLQLIAVTSSAVRTWFAQMDIGDINKAKAYRLMHAVF